MNIPIRLPRQFLPSRAFTLIELLVVISIIGILASLAFPAFQAALRMAHLARATANARQIGIGLITYAADHEGAFPTVDPQTGQPFASSNAAFRELVPEYIDDESIFAERSSSVGPKADHVTEPPEEVLKPGEVHFAYIAGLSTSSKSYWPLVVDGTDGNGYYVRDSSRPGGTWEGRKAVAVTVGGSASQVPLEGSPDQRFIPRREHPEQNALIVDYMGSNVARLEPLTR